MQILKQSIMAFFSIMLAACHSPLVCEEGYQGENCDQCAAGYQDKDENGTCLPDCSTSDLSCGDHGQCNDSGGTTSCDCDEDYEWVDQTCKLIVPVVGCESNPCKAAFRTQCSLEEGLIVCSCDDGYVLDVEKDKCVRYEYICESDECGAHVLRRACVGEQCPDVYDLFEKCGQDDLCRKLATSERPECIPCDNGCSAGACIGCDGGACCNDQGQLESLGEVCLEQVQYRCSTNDCDAIGQKRILQWTCDGQSADCVGNPTDPQWELDNDCSSNDLVCKTDGTSFTSCQQCPFGCFAGDCKECDTGACCNAQGQIEPKNKQCQNDVVQYQCSEGTCASEAQERTLEWFCDGTSAECPVDPKEGDWVGVACDITQQCVSDDATYARCESCGINGICLTEQQTCEIQNIGDSSYSFRIKKVWDDQKFHYLGVGSSNVLKLVESSNGTIDSWRLSEKSTGYYAIYYCPGGDCSDYLVITPECFSDQDDTLLVLVPYVGHESQHWMLMQTDEPGYYYISTQDRVITGGIDNSVKLNHNHAFDTQKWEQQKSRIIIDDVPVLYPRTSPDWIKWQTDPSVIKVDNTWIMYFGCNNEGVTTQIGMATSTDGINWVVDTTGPVISVGPQGAWDDTDVETPWVIYDPTAPAEQRYKMWYSAQGNQGDNRPDISYQIGYAYSNDGIHWTKYKKPGNNGDDPRYAESDPVFQNAVFVPDDDYPADPADYHDGWAVAEPSVIVLNDGTFRMYYVGAGVDPDTVSVFGLRIFSASSPDGINWTRNGMVLEATLSDYEATSISCSSIAVIGGKYILFYTMVDQDFIEGEPTIERGYTGVAISDDGISFDRYSSSPIIGHGLYGTYYMSGAFAATPIIVDDLLYVYFSSFRHIPSPLTFDFHIGRMRWIGFEQELFDLP